VDKTTKLCDKLIQLQSTLSAKKDKKNKFGNYYYPLLRPLLQ